MVTVTKPVSFSVSRLTIYDTGLVADKLLPMNNGSKIKIVQIIADSEPGGGPAHVLGLLKALDSAKFEKFLVCPTGFLSTEAKKITGVKVINIPMKSKFDWISILEIKKALDSIQSGHDPFGPMVVHIHGVRAGLLGRLAVPKTVLSIYTEHRYDGDYHLKNSLNEFFQKLTLRWLNRKSHRIIAVSSSVKKFLINNELAESEQVVVIPNAINTDGDRKVKKIREANRPPLLGNIGNLNIQKGQVYLIDAMREVVRHFPSASLEIIGEGEERKNLTNKIKSLGLERHISLLGRKKDPSKYLSHWDVFVLPSVAETFGIAILEAMSNGIPVIASKVGGIPDIIDSRKNGLLVKCRDSKVLAKAIINILDHPATAAKYKREGLKRVADYEWKNVIKEIERVYEAPFNKVKE